MIKVVNDLLTAVERKTPSVLLLIDISAEFDTIDHRRLRQQTKQLLGISGATLEWLRFFLENRGHSVSVDGRNSKTVTLTNGVPQESVYGPLLFSIFTITVDKLI